ncbi:uncharacterized protein L969DRAFT_69948 [Mixia osmundae IAM 14324]|uniref:Uncharacterized protein n=1 Tax=Mixia osmundae (strain CBS 9802 / IAM 14324 / JCM 22182 / KY 12970) TaxID=764103 RepID=G7E558_MIXOS|nr:uncharacterized protein L969DRAFT_69948 [Mixia osmundae IAM 14324]KEI42675.1 hypothetical protein L969DRAFT_69948 [Mixia osmundae IAM 14324]GAA97968.1 hypothetical protein E5Q_04648 [Mixia osmundae IAM 14324]
MQDHPMTDKSELESLYADDKQTRYPDFLAKLDEQLAASSLPERPQPTAYGLPPPSPFTFDELLRRPRSQEGRYSALSNPTEYGRPAELSRTLPEHDWNKHARKRKRMLARFGQGVFALLAAVFSITGAVATHPATPSPLRTAVTTIALDFLAISCALWTVWHFVLRSIFKSDQGESGGCCGKRAKPDRRSMHHARPPTYYSHLGGSSYAMPPSDPRIDVDIKARAARRRIKRTMVNDVLFTMVWIALLVGMFATGKTCTPGAFAGFCTYYNLALTCSVFVSASFITSITLAALDLSRSSV